MRATAVTLTYENMKKQLKAVHDSAGNDKNDHFDINCELIMVINHRIIPIGDQKKNTEAIIVSIFIT